MLHAREDYNRIQDPAGLIPDNEPVFLIRGQDKAAEAAIAAWIKEARFNGASEDILKMANDQIARIRKWQAMAMNKVPDVPPGTQMPGPFIGA